MIGLPVVAVVGGACWVGKWVLDLNALPRGSQTQELPPVASSRLARADRLTRLGAGVVERALSGMSSVNPTRLAIMGGSVLASLNTNEKYERRRVEKGVSAPRDFAFTAPNAWVGEIAAAVEAQGPSTCLVGPGSALAAIGIASRWLAAEVCDRVIVVAAESLPEDTSLMNAEEAHLLEGACAVVLERPKGHETHCIRAEWVPFQPSTRYESVESLATVWLQARNHRKGIVETRSIAGAGIRIVLV